MRKEKVGPSVGELKMKGDLDRLRREIGKLKRAGANGAEGGAAVLGAETLAALQAQVDALEKTRERLSRLYFRQIDDNRRRTRQLHQLLRVLSEISAHLDLETLLQRLAEAICDTLGYRIVLVRLREPGAPAMHAVAAVGLRPAARAQLEAEDVPVDDFRAWLRDEFKVSRSFFISHRSAFSRVLPVGVVK